MNKSTAPSGSPSPRTRYQLQYLYRCKSGQPHQTHLYQRLLQAITSQLYGCPRAQEQLLTYFHQVMAKETALDPKEAKADQKNQADKSYHTHAATPELLYYAQRRLITDPEIYALLRLYYHQHIRTSDEVVAYKRDHGNDDNESGRAGSRIRDLLDLLAVSVLADSTNETPPQSQTKRKAEDSVDKTSVAVESFLDLGCAEASITTALAQHLHLKPEQCHGIDVLPMTDFRSKDHATHFTFTLIKPEETTLPYADATFDLVLCLMSLHHIAHHQQTIQQVVRILKPGGRLILREHDLYAPGLEVLLDVVHGLYDEVWNGSEPLSSTTQDFCSTYAAYYQPREYWVRVLMEAGLKQHPRSPDNQALYRRPLSIYKFQPGRPVPNPLAAYYGLYFKPLDSSSNSCASASKHLKCS